MNEQEEIIDKKFNAIVNKRPPAKFPELRYLWGITLLGSFVLVVITTLLTSIIEAL